NAKPTPVFLREILESEEFRNSRRHLPCCLGKMISGQAMVADLVEMPHLLIAGTTGSGKSVCLNAIICSFLMRFAPDKLKFIMVDPKRVELNVYQDIPHLLSPVVNDPRKAAGALNWLVEQMEERYKMLADFNVRNIDGFNTMFDPKNYSKKLIGHNLQPMPRIVVIIDELADLMMVARNEVEDAVIHLAQMARAVGIHLILATQRPSVNVITGIIKANFPVRIAFRVSSNVDSRTILDTKGAETLLGKGDMLYMSVRSPRPERLQGCFVSDKEVEMLTDFIRNQQRAIYVMQDFKAPSELEKERMEASMEMEAEAEAASSSGTRDGANWEVMGQMTHPDGTPMKPEEIWMEYMKDDLFRAASKLIMQNRSASVSLIQRRLKVGFARSGRLMDMLQESGIVGEHKGSKPRDIIVDPIRYLNLIEQYESRLQIGGRGGNGELNS
ncbi:MAG: DNA translocase FtsK, partial [Candidatus Sumerlaeota bacterium]|nr:DNA translocase FtsK [Candidatus Sumerlaeota bacterium]